ncbi:MAG: GNAT family N-acetyltransferase [Phycisphaerae bacterium]
MMEAVCPACGKAHGKGKRKASSGPADRHASLRSIAVAPEMRGSGVAMELIRCFERDVAEKGLSRVSLTVFADNERAIHFYEKAGWTASKRTPRSLCFVRELPVKG